MGMKPKFAAAAANGSLWTEAREVSSERLAEIGSPHSVSFVTPPNFSHGVLIQALGAFFEGTHI